MKIGLKAKIPRNNLFNETKKAFFISHLFENHPHILTYNSVCD